MNFVKDFTLHDNSRRVDNSSSVDDIKHKNRTPKDAIFFIQIVIIMVSFFAISANFS